MLQYIDCVNRILCHNMYSQMSFCHALSRSSLLARDGDKHGADGVVLRISVQFFVFICANFTALSPAASSLTDHYSDPIRNHVKEGAIYIVTQC